MLPFPLGYSPLPDSNAMSWLDLSGTLDADKRKDHKLLTPHRSARRNSLQLIPTLNSNVPLVSSRSRPRTAPSLVEHEGKHARPPNTTRTFLSRRRTSTDATAVTRKTSPYISYASLSGYNDPDTVHSQVHTQLPEIVDSKSLVSKVSTKSSKSGESFGQKLAQGLRRLSGRKPSTSNRKEVQYTRYGGRGLRRIKAETAPAIEIYVDRHLEPTDTVWLSEDVPTRERGEGLTSYTESRVTEAVSTP